MPRGRRQRVQRKPTRPPSFPSPSKPLGQTWFDRLFGRTERAGRRGRQGRKGRRPPTDGREGLVTYPGAGAGPSSTNWPTPEETKGWTAEDWEKLLPPPQPTEGVFFNPNIPRSDVFQRDDENRIRYDPDTGAPLYESREFSEYMEREGVIPAFTRLGQNVPRAGRWTDWILGKYGYGYGDQGVDPYRLPQLPQQLEQPFGGGGGYYGGGYGRGGGGGGGSYSPFRPEQNRTGKFARQDYGQPNYDRDWLMEMVKWRMGR